jgi:hypothetical protein
VPYTSLTVADYGNTRCGRRDDGLVRCASDYSLRWGVAPPTSEFVFEQFEVERNYSERMSCGLTAEHRVRCGAIAGFIPILPPTVRVRQVTSLGQGSLALLEDGRLVGRGYAQVSDAPEPGDRFVQVAANENLPATFCALRADGSAQCWAHGLTPQPQPTDRFVEISLTFNARCGRRADGSIACWSGTWQPAGTFDSLFVVHESTCARRSDGVFLCDSTPPFGIPSNVVQFAANNRTSCGLSGDGRLVCAPEAAPARTLGRRFRQVAAAYNNNLCALALDGEAICWGQTFDPPSGVQSPFKDFVSVSVSNFSACGVRADGNSVCWPEFDWYRLPH